MKELQNVTPHGCRRIIGRGLQFELFKPGSVNVKEYYAELPIAVRVTGTYHDLGAFASDIAQLSRIVTLNDIVIGANPAPGGGPLAMNTTAKTFRYLDSEEVAAQRKSKAPAKGTMTFSLSRATRQSSSRPVTASGAWTA